MTGSSQPLPVVMVAPIEGEEFPMIRQIFPFFTSTFTFIFCSLLLSHLLLLLGKPIYTKTDEFPENFRTAFDPPRKFIGFRIYRLPLV